MNESFEIKYTISDPLHKKIEISNIVDAIICTEHFQRLKKIGQLGVLNFIYPEANHTRYEHCIGTYHLAGQMLEYLITNTKGLKISDFHKNCVKIAGLLHDVGHGPFSHLWESALKGKIPSHEENCGGCIDAIFQEITFKLSAEYEEHMYGIELIKALIWGDKSMIRRQVKGQIDYLFMIINNKENGIDVDKWDYLQRDNYYVGQHRVRVKYSVDNIGEVFQNARVDKSRTFILYDHKTYKEICNIYDVRSKFHIHLYKNPMCMLLEEILTEMIQYCDDNENYKFPLNENGKKFSEITSETETFLELYNTNVMEYLKEIQEDFFTERINWMENVKEIIEIPSNEWINYPHLRFVEIKQKKCLEEMETKTFKFYDFSENDHTDIEASFQRGFHQAKHFFTRK